MQKHEIWSELSATDRQEPSPGSTSVLQLQRGATILIVLELLGDGEEVPHAPWVGDISAQLYVTLDLYSQPTEAENVPCDLNNMEKSTPGLES